MKYFRGWMKDQRCAVCKRRLDFAYMFYDIMTTEIVYKCFNHLSLEEFNLYNEWREKQGPLFKPPPEGKNNKDWKYKRMY